MSDEIPPDLREQITHNLRVKDTEELLEIWKKHDLTQWNEAAFVVISELLKERLGEVPPHDSPAEPTNKSIVSDTVVKPGKFIWGWLLVNLIGWATAIMYLIAAHDREIIEDLANTYVEHTPDTLIVVLGMAGIPLGLALGFLQSIQMSSWKVPWAGWFLATALGWIIPAFCYSQFRHYLIFSDDFMIYYQYMSIIYALILMVVGFSVGGFQVLVMGKRMSKPGLWILANIAGTLIFGLVINLMVKVPIHIISGPIDILFNPKLRTGIEAIPLSIMWLLLVLLTPVLAALLIGLPTGVIFQRYHTASES